MLKDHLEEMGKAGSSSRVPLNIHRWTVPFQIPLVLVAVCEGCTWPLSHVSNFLGLCGYLTYSSIFSEWHQLPAFRILSPTHRELALFCNAAFSKKPAKERSISSIVYLIGQGVGRKKMLKFRSGVENVFPFSYIYFSLFTLCIMKFPCNGSDYLS